MIKIIGGGGGDGIKKKKKKKVRNFTWDTLNFSGPPKSQPVGPENSLH